jgi:Helix-turn-helix of DDE superfamily endonuclease
MKGLRYQDVAQRESEVLALTSLTPSEFAELLPAFEQAFQERMEDYCLDGKPRRGRGYVCYENSPLPTPEDRLLFILVYLKTNPLQVAHGRLFGLPQNKANQWIHTLLPVLQQSLHAQGDAPRRTLADLERYFQQQGEQSPFFVTMEQNDASRVHKMQINRRASIAARKNATHEKTSC